MKYYLLIFTIGPVQSFIAQARKTQDLYAGSRILSDLIDCAITTLGERGQVCFPIFDSGSRAKSIPNRFVAKICILEDKNIDTYLKKLGEEIENSVRNKFKTWAEKRVIDFYTERKIKFHSSIITSFYNQISSHLEIFWAFNALEKDKYFECYTELERILGGVKSFRPIINFSEQGRKCSIDGVNNALFYRSLDSNNIPFGLNNESTCLIDEKVKVFNKEKPKYQLKKGEAISAVSMLKRHYLQNSDRGFPSTAEISLMKSLKPYEGCQLIKSVIDLDAQLFYEENRTLAKIKEALNENEDDTAYTNAEELKKDLDNFINNQKDIKWDKYYAIIQFDGDKMGAWLSGKEDVADSTPTRLKKETELEAFHKQLSSNLQAFAQIAKNYLDSDCNGKTIYAGGDDFLGFVNLRALFSVLKEFQARFDEVVNNEDLLDLLKSGGSEHKLTFSAGISIAHYKEPLSIALENARKAEKIAKEKGERNAFAFIASKHAGETHQACFNWVYQDNFKPLEVLECLWQALRKNKINANFFRNLSSELRLLMGSEGIVIHDVAPLSSEIHRLLKRNQYHKEFPELNTLAKSLTNLAKHSDYQMTNFLEQLYIIDFLARQTPI